MLRFEHLTKQYGKFTALDDFCAELDTGIYALLGPNGAGKSTLMKLLTGLLAPTNGKIIRNGEDIAGMGERFRSLLGYMPQYPGFYSGFSAMEMMQYMGEMKGLSKKQAKERGTELLKAVNLSTAENKKIGTFSGGMRQRLGLAQALINQPEILILDEPTAGLDPKERIRFRSMMNRLAQNMTVIFCTHIVSDIETIAKEVLLIHHGKLLRQRTVAELIEEMKGKVWEITPEEMEIESLIDRYPRSGLISRNLHTVIRIVSAEKPEEKAVPVEPILEDVYLWLFGEDSE